jgi:putative DNA primase/helicase
MIDEQQQQAREQRLQELKSRAHGHWTSILRGLGVDDEILNGKNQPCPIASSCGAPRRASGGGKMVNVDRFQYTDKFGEGNYHCRHCGAGGGLKLAQGVLGIPFHEVLERVERQLGCVSRTPVMAGPSPERMKRLCQRIWQEAKPVTLGDEVDRYLRNRGIVLNQYPKTLRFHPALGYYEKQDGQQRAKKIAEYPAMIACVQGSDGHAVTLHRTYLKDGKKALGSQSKKVLSSGINGASVRLDEPTDELAITEGLETGLAVRLSTGKPLWAALNCGNLEKLWIPEAVKRVCIYADNDADGEFAGQLSAYALAQRLVRESRNQGLDRVVRVYVPKHDGTDWADVWLANLANDKKAA